MRVESLSYQLSGLQKQVTGDSPASSALEPRPFPRLWAVGAA